MSNTARLLAALLSLIAAPALAQNVPANTVQGRLGIPAAGGLVQSIPIPSLAPLLGIPPITNSMQGAVRVWPIPSSVPNTVGNLIGFNANGGTIGCNALLPSNCVQAAINTALPSAGAIFTQDFQRDVEIKLGYAGDHLPITWPAYQNVVGRVTGTGFLDATHDSCEMCDFQYLGTQLFSLVFNPLNRGAPGGDLLFQHVDSRWFAHTVFSVQFPKASFTNNELKIIELNADPQLVPGTPLFSVPSVAPALGNFGGNHFEVTHAHASAGKTSTYFKIGNGTPTPGVQFGDNFWNLHIDNRGSDGTQDGFVSYASKDIKIIRSEGFTSTGKNVWYRSGAQDNILIAQSDAGTVVTDDNSTSSTNLQIIGGKGMFFGLSEYMRSDNHTRFGFAYANNGANGVGTVLNTTGAGTSGQIMVAQTGTAPILQTPTQYLDNIGTTDGFMISRLGGSWVANASPILGGAMTAQDYLIGASNIFPRIVFVGDSLTFGTGATFPYPHYITMPTYNGLAFTQSNIGVGGRTLQSMALLAYSNLNTLYSSQSGMNIAVVWGGHNDFAAGSSVAQTYSYTQQLCQHLRSLGWRVVVATQTSSTDQDANGSSLSTLVRASWWQFADALADLNANASIGALGAFSSGTYFYTDHVHLTDAGYTVAAGIIQTAITSALNGADRITASSTTTLTNKTFDTATNSLFFTTSQIFNFNATTAPTRVAPGLQLVATDSSAIEYELDTFATNGNLRFRRSNGTNASKSALATDNVIGSLRFDGYGATGYGAASRAVMSVFAGQTWTDAAQGTYFDLQTTPNGGTATSTVLRVTTDQGIIVPIAVTGGSKGAGTLNAAGLYDTGNRVATAAGTNAFTGANSFPVGGGAGTVKPSGLLSTQTTPTGNAADLIEATLQSYSLPASSFNANGQILKVTAWGNFAADAHNKRVRLYFGSTILGGSGIVVTSGSNWYFQAIITRSGSNTQTYNLYYVDANGPQISATTATETDTSAIVIKTTGQVTSGTTTANDVQGLGLTVEASN